MTASDSSALTDAWQAALAAEHRAVFGYALLGPRLAEADQGLAVTDSDAHESLRDATAGRIAAAGLSPVPSEPDYPALYPVPDAAAARTLAVRLEDDCAAAWRFLYATAAARRSAGATARRQDAQSALAASAIRAMRWRARIDPARATTAFPGV